MVGYFGWQIGMCFRRMWKGNMCCICIWYSIILGYGTIASIMGVILTEMSAPDLCENTGSFHISHIHYTKKVKDICQYVDINTKIKTISWNSTKHLENFKISLTFLCSVLYVTCSTYSAGKNRAQTNNLQCAELITDHLIYQMYVHVKHMFCTFPKIWTLDWGYIRWHV